MDYLKLLSRKLGLLYLEVTENKAVTDLLCLLVFDSVDNLSSHNHVKTQFIFSLSRKPELLYLVV